MPPDNAAPRANDLIVVPLFHSSLPVSPSRAYRIARDERRARSAAFILLSLVRNSPPEVTKTTPLMIVGGSGETRSREAQAGCNVSAPFCSTSFQATTAPFAAALLNPSPAACEPTAGASIQRPPLASCQLASAPGAVVPAFDEACVV